MAGNRTRVNCLEGSYAHHYTTIAWMTQFSDKSCTDLCNFQGLTKKMFWPFDKGPT